MAKFYFNKDEYLELTNKELGIQQNEQYKSYALSNMRQLSVSFKYLIVPLMVGGIVVPLGSIAFFSNYISGWPGLAIIITGIFLLYFGVKGSYQVLVETYNSSFTFFIEDKDQRLDDFIAKVNQAINQKH